MAKFLANENVPGDAVVAVRAAGHDLAWVKEVGPGADDESVLALSMAQQRVLVTFDKDFGEMAFRLGSAASCGIILLRPHLRSPQHVTGFTLAVLRQPVIWEGHFWVAKEGRLRSTPLPSTTRP